MGSALRSDVCQKLRSIGCYIDDELPDYVMAMVSNKKSTASMIKDLTLFLGGHTESFVKWLHEQLGKSDDQAQKTVASNGQMKSAAKLVSSSSRSSSTVAKELSPDPGSRKGHARMLSLAMAGANASTKKPNAAALPSIVADQQQGQLAPTANQPRRGVVTSGVSSARVGSAVPLHGHAVGTESSSVATVVLPPEEEPSASRIVQPAKNTRFIVTLDGGDDRYGNIAFAQRENDEVEERPTVARPSALKRLGTQVAEENEDFEQEEEEEDAGKPPAKSARTLERCRYWPKCTAGDDCRYHHPSAPCRNFPKCKYGMSCLFVHPDCKFDGFCSRSDCPFLHRKVQNPSMPVAMPPHMPAQVATASSTVECRFFPNCARPDCPFFHPVPCRFGANCTRRDCKFSHPSMVPSPIRGPMTPSRSTMTWMKKTHVSDRQFAFTGPVTSMPTPSTPSSSSSS